MMTDVKRRDTRPIVDRNQLLSFFAAVVFFKRYIRRLLFWLTGQTITAHTFIKSKKIEYVSKKQDFFLRYFQTYVLHTDTVPTTGRYRLRLFVIYYYYYCFIRVVRLKLLDRQSHGAGDRTRSGARVRRPVLARPTCIIHAGRDGDEADSPPRDRRHRFNSTAILRPLNSSVPTDAISLPQGRGDLERPNTSVLGDEQRRISSASDVTRRDLYVFT